METAVRDVTFAAGEGLLRGELAVPSRADAVVVLVTGSCGGVQAPPESELRSQLNDRDIGTFAVDLLTANEAHERDNRRDIGLLASRVDSLLGWLGHKEELDSHGIAVYAADTAAPAVLDVVGTDTAAVALRNGRLDLIDDHSNPPELPLYFVCDRQNKFLHRIHETAYATVYEENPRTEYRAVDGPVGIERIADWFERELGSRPPRAARAEND